MKLQELSKYLGHPKKKLKEINTYENFGYDEETLKELLKKKRKKLSKLQQIIYAKGQYAILVCLQGMDTSGKDSLIREVFKSFNVSGIVVHSFKVPTALEKKHDFLWRHYIALPIKGKFAVFNRTHYENVLVTRVHPEYILNENIPNIKDISDITKDFWNQRYAQINHFEKHLSENGTIILKFFLHISKEEQRQRLLRRINIKEKNWKFSSQDLKERKLWQQYQNCYEEAIQNTSKENAPWYIIPADHKKAARLLVAEIILKTLKQHKNLLDFKLSEATQTNLQHYKEELKNES